MSKKSLYISAVVAISMSIFYFFQFINISSKTNEKQFSFDMPKIMVIKTTYPKTNLLQYSYIWGKNQMSSGFLSSSTTLANTKKTFNSGYVYKKINGIPSICSASDNSYRWEFYGIGYKNGKLWAIFYNPSIKKAKALSVNKQLDKGLIIKKISSDEVSIEYGKKTFVLKIFEFTKKKKNEKKGS